MIVSKFMHVVLRNLFRTEEQSILGKIIECVEKAIERSSKSQFFIPNALHTFLEEHREH
jgi:hypothetical protein